MREWNGRTHTVTVEEDGFTYAGRNYRSLSAIAREITGARWSGPRFFGLAEEGRLRCLGDLRPAQRKAVEAALCHLYPQVIRGGPGAGLQLARCATGSLRGLYRKSKARRAGWPCRPNTTMAAILEGRWNGQPCSAFWRTSAAAKVDVVVVYKIDRLTRSLLDFAKIVEVFDAHDVAFVSVTQAFNTTTSMGRLTLNVLLSFAQFEREVTGERIRDKIAASKKKGMWMGGYPPLGYDVKDRKLVVNEAEAETVRYIFRRYQELRSVRLLKDHLDAAGIVSKRRTAPDGRPYGGKPIARGALYLMLQNRIYRGEIVHKDRPIQASTSPRRQGSLAGSAGAACKQPGRPWAGNSRQAAKPARRSSSSTHTAGR